MMMEDVMDRRMQELTTVATCAIKNAKSENPTNVDERVAIDLFTKNTKHYSQKNRHHPHQFLEQFNDPIVNDTLSNATKIMLFKSCVKINSKTWEQRSQTAKTYHDLTKVFLEVFWDTIAQNEALKHFTKENE